MLRQIKNEYPGRIILLLLFTLFVNIHSSNAQSYSVSTNTLEWAKLGTINLDASIIIGYNWTLHLSGAYNPWTFKENKKLKHILIEPGVRYWTWQTYVGSYFSANLMASRFNGGFKKRHDGYGFGLNFNYGYAWMINRRWNFELEGGLGLLAGKYSLFECKTCGERLSADKKFLTPTPKFAANIAYLF